MKPKAGLCEPCQWFPKMKMDGQRLDLPKLGFICIIYSVTLYVRYIYMIYIYHIYIYIYNIDIYDIYIYIYTIQNILYCNNNNIYTYMINIIYLIYIYNIYLMNK